MLHDVTPFLLPVWGGQHGQYINIRQEAQGQKCTEGMCPSWTHPLLFFFGLRCLELDKVHYILLILFGESVIPHHQVRLRHSAFQRGIFFP